MLPPVECGVWAIAVVLGVAAFASGCGGSADATSVQRDGPGASTSTTPLPSPDSPAQQACGVLADAVCARKVDCARLDAGDSRRGAFCIAATLASCLEHSWLSVDPAGARRCADERVPEGSCYKFFGGFGADEWEPWLFSCEQDAPTVPIGTPCEFSYECETKHCPFGCGACEDPGFQVSGRVEDVGDPPSNYRGEGACRNRYLVAKDGQCVPAPGEPGALCPNYECDPTTDLVCAPTPRDPNELGQPNQPYACVERAPDGGPCYKEHACQQDSYCEGLAYTDLGGLPPGTCVALQDAAFEPGAECPFNGPVGGSRVCHPPMGCGSGSCQFPRNLPCYQ